MLIAIAGVFSKKIKLSVSLKSSSCELRFEKISGVSILFSKICGIISTFFFLESPSKFSCLTTRRNSSTIEQSSSPDSLANFSAVFRSWEWTKDWFVLFEFLKMIKIKDLCKQIFVLKNYPRKSVFAFDSLQLLAWGGKTSKSSQKVWLLSVSVNLFDGASALFENNSINVFCLINLFTSGTLKLLHVLLPLLEVVTDFGEIGLKKATFPFLAIALQIHPFLIAVIEFSSVSGMTTELKSSFFR